MHAHVATKVQNAERSTIGSVLLDLLRYVAVLPAVGLVYLIVPVLLDFMVTAEFGQHALEAISGTLLGGLWDGLQDGVTACAAILMAARVAPRHRAPIATIVAILLVAVLLRCQFACFEHAYLGRGFDAANGVLVYQITIR